MEVLERGVWVKQDGIIYDFECSKCLAKKNGVVLYLVSMHTVLEADGRSAHS